MRVLYLAPPARPAAAIAAHSFIAEEIDALGRAGITAYALTDETTSDFTIGAVRVMGMPSPRSWDAARRALAFAARFPSAAIARVWSAEGRADALRAVFLEAVAADLVRREQIDVIHSHFAWPGGFGGRLAAHSTKRPLVASLRGMDILTDAGFGHGLRLEGGFNAAVQALLRTADAIVTATDFMRARAIALGAAPDRVRKIVKGVSTELFTPADNRAALQQQLGLRPPVVLAVGNLKRLKGFDVLLAAVRRMKTPCTVVICGDGPERRRLEDASSELMPATTVRFVGHLGRDLIPRYFAAADLFVHPAHMEAAGNVILEALASACPVISTASGGPEEFVRHGETGLIVPVNDADALSRAMTSLLLDHSLRRTMGTAARQYVLASHRYSLMVEEILQLYAAVSTALCSAA